MIFLSFSGSAFNKTYSESNIYMIISPKGEHASQMDFLYKAVGFVNDKVYPGEDFGADYKGISLKEGRYEDIVKNWIASMDKSIEIKFDEIKDILRIKCTNSDPYRDEYLIETGSEYIMFLWSTTA
ncbi:MAG: hypothetical protein K6G87_00845 [Butyrivibrio sp.]|uniref:hypothetical protein n=1 Tax=Butyrivibrio sp. TaxID=28121 RepID=UPI0025DEC1B6|nr:hypothetical protein [Butyrivibrio sp.]MCR5769759.1 hypothetical protein [Butyrivibrio sp.]